VLTFYYYINVIMIIITIIVVTAGVPMDIICAERCVFCPYHRGAVKSILFTITATGIVAAGFLRISVAALVLIFPGCDRNCTTVGKEIDLDSDICRGKVKFSKLCCVKGRSPVFTLFCH
jgi:hypothetical protein